MSNRVIEPSEILVEQDYGHAKPSKVNPWVRLVARFTDYSLFCLTLLFFERMFDFRLFSDSFAKLIPFEFFSWIPLETLFLATWGKTPGKWFLQIDLRFKGKFRAQWIVALRRSVSVWWRGLGLGIPILNVLCLLIAYQRLKVTHTTSWDREDQIHVAHRLKAQWRVNAAVLFSALGMLVYFSMKNSL